MSEDKLIKKLQVTANKYIGCTNNRRNLSYMMADLYKCLPYGWEVDVISGEGSVIGNYVEIIVTPASFTLTLDETHDA